MRIDPSSQYLGNDPSQSVGNAQGQPKLSSAAAGAPFAAESNAPDAAEIASSFPPPSAKCNG